MIFIPLFCFFGNFCFIFGIEAGAFHFQDFQVTIDFTVQERPTAIRSSIHQLKTRRRREQQYVDDNLFNHKSRTAMMVKWQVGADHRSQRLSSLLHSGRTRTPVLMSGTVGPLYVRLKLKRQHQITHNLITTYCLTITHNIFAYCKIKSTLFSSTKSYCMRLGKSAYGV